MQHILNNTLSQIIDSVSSFLVIILIMSILLTVVYGINTIYSNSK